MENARFLHKLARLRADAVDARGEARLAREWGWVGYMNDVIAMVDRELRIAAQEQAKALENQPQQLELGPRNTGQAS